MESEGCTTKKITHEILAYLVEHPEAQDTLEGIVGWWLLEQEIKRQTVKVKKALAELVAKGLVLERQGKDSRTFYRINKRKRKEIQSLLQKSDIQSS